jgi:hypothetical protein
MLTIFKNQISLFLTFLLLFFITFSVLRVDGTAYYQNQTNFSPISYTSSSIYSKPKKNILDTIFFDRVKSVQGTPTDYGEYKRYPGLLNRILSLFYLPILVYLFIYLFVYTPYYHFNKLIEKEKKKTDKKNRRQS